MHTSTCSLPALRGMVSLTPWFSLARSLMAGRSAQLRGNEAGEMSNIGGGNNDVGNAKQKGLGRENHIGIERLIRSGWLALLTGERPQLGGFSHGVGCQRKVIELLAIPIEIGKPASTVNANKLSSYLIICNLGNDHPPTST